MNPNDCGHARLFIAFLIATAAVIVVPLLPVAPRYDTFIHPFRPEIVASLSVFVLGIWSSLTGRMGIVFESVAGSELRIFILPLILFISWSSLSVVWAESWRSVLHHSGVWICYLAFYVFARHFFERPEWQDTAILVMVGIVILICAGPILEYYSLTMIGIPPRIGLRYSRYNELLVTLFPLIFVFGLTGSKLQRFVGGIALTMIAVLIFATSRRTGMAILVVELIACLGIVYAVRGFKAHRYRALKISGAVLAVLVLFQVVSFALTSAIPASERYNDPFVAVSDGLRRIVGTVAIKMGTENPLTGVGANNYGQLYGKYPQDEAYLEKFPMAAAVLEDQIAERAHNEYLQIFGELGAVGIGLFLLFILGIGAVIWKEFRRSGELPMLSIASLIGVGAFLASSLVSSYSFRLVQNGVAFFIVVAIGSATFTNTRSQNSFRDRKTLSIPFAALILIGSFALLAVNINRIYAVHLAITSEAELDYTAKIAKVDKAMTLDPDNASIASYSAAIYKGEQDYATAALRYRTAIDRGRITVVDYFNLSSAYLLEGRKEDSLTVVREGLTLYPRSVFLLVRQGLLFEEMQLTQDSNASFAKARSVNQDQADVWESYQRNGGRIASIRAHELKLLAVMDLHPESAILVVKAEREIRFPYEKFDLP